MLELLSLRQEAQRRMGEQFSLPAFHAAVLQNGGLPLSLLERELEERLR